MIDTIDVFLTQFQKDTNFGGAFKTIPTQQMVARKAGINAEIQALEKNI